MKKKGRVQNEHKRVEGYTFIEILVVVSVIAVLVAIALVSYGSINKRSRDARRKSDIEQIRSALEMYRADNETYPNIGSGFQPITSYQSLSDYLSTFPEDPKDNETYYYRIYTGIIRVSPDPIYLDYCVEARLEMIAEGEEDNNCGTPLDESYNYGRKNP